MIQRMNCVQNQIITHNNWYAEDTENNLGSMKDCQQMCQDIMRTIRGALEMSKLVKESRYDEHVLNTSRLL
jgi:hypothetical protein